MGFVDVSAGQTIASAHMDLAISQSVMRFANTAERDSQLPAPVTGMICYVTDVAYLMIYRGYWRPVGTMRMGFGRFAAQTIESTSSGNGELLTFDTFGSGANTVGRAAWNVNGEITVPLAGLYLFSARVTWPSNTNGERRLMTLQDAGNGWTFGGASTAVSGGTSEASLAGTLGANGFSQSVTATIQAPLGSKIGLFASHNSNAGPLALAAGHGGASLFLLSAD